MRGDEQSMSLQTKFRKKRLVAGSGFVVVREY